MFLPPHDLHTHTTHCGHASPCATAANLLAAAAERGLKLLGISEHVVLPEHVERLRLVRDDLARLGPRPRLPAVLVGAEIDPDPFRLDGRWVAEVVDADYAVLSPHRLPGHGLMPWEVGGLGLSGQKLERLGRRWLDWYACCVECARKPVILGHSFREPLLLGLFSLRDEHILARAVSAVAVAAGDAVAFEVNDAWIDRLGRTDQFHAYAELVGQLKRDGMTFSRGSDAHQAADVGAGGGLIRLAAAAGLEEQIPISSRSMYNWTGVILGGDGDQRPCDGDLRAKAPCQADQEADAGTGGRSHHTT